MTDFSGMDVPSMAMENIGKPFDLLSASERRRAAREFIEQNSSLSKYARMPKRSPTLPVGTWICIWQDSHVSRSSWQALEVVSTTSMAGEMAARSVWAGSGP